jgi:hypothetical protein
MKLSPFISPYKNQLKMHKILNARPEIMKWLEVNRGATLQDIGLDKKCFDSSPQITEN